MKPSIRVVHSSGMGGLPCHSRWIYLGKGVEAYQRTRRRLGVENEWPQDERLREMAEQLRQPFLDFVARVGARQKDPITWWSTRFSWKLWTASDLFLLTCYLALAESIIQEARTNRFSLLLIVEDGWLLRQLKENLRLKHPQTRVQPASLLKERAACLFLGAARRVHWLLTTLRNRWKQQQRWPHAQPPCPTEPTIGIFSYPSQSAFDEPDAWRDAHLPHLDEAITEMGFRTGRFIPPECGGWEKELAGRSSYAYPLILWATAGRVLRSLTAFWLPRWPETLEVNRIPIRWLCFREGWLEVGRSSLCGYRLFYECLRGMLSQGSWRALVTFYENQPWEKLQVLAARARAIRTIGIQTTHFSRYHLSYALGEGEAKRLPLPDRIGSSGAAAHRLLLECGTPAALLSRCGALRYGHLTGPRPSNGENKMKAPELRTVLVVLSIDPVLSRHLLEALHQAFPDGGAGDQLRLLIRPHPMTPIPNAWIRFPASLLLSTFVDFREALHSCDGVLFTASTVGFEALAEGKPVVRYRSSRLFDTDDMYESFLPIVSDSNLRTELLRHLRAEHPAAGPEEIRRFILDHFSPVDREGLKVALS